MANVKRYFFLLATILVLSTAALSAEDSTGLIFNITEWDTGTLEPGIVAAQSVEIENRTDNNVTINLISTCGCLTTEPDMLELPRDGRGTFLIKFDSSDDVGEFEKILIIQTDSDAMPKGFFIVTGRVEGSDKAESAYADPQESAAASDAALLYYYTPGCKSCNSFLKNSELPIEKRDITEAQYYEELQLLLEAADTTLREIPVLVSGNYIFQGEDEIRNGYADILEGRISMQTGSTVFSGKSVSTAINLSFLAVAAAGLLDGVNPCAFTTLIFLLSALGVAGKSRRETLIIGLFFTVSVFLTYYLIGLGFFKIIRIADSFELISRIIRWLLFSVLLIFAGLSFFDYTKIKAGKSSEILLQLPHGVKRRMHSYIRSYSKSAALAGSSIIMGFLISIFELGCTGQIYFPTITYIIQTGEPATGYLYLILYNLAFILPLIVVFIVVFFGVTSKKITKMFQKNLGIIKVLTGFIFLCFAILMVVI